MEPTRLASLLHEAAEVIREHAAQILQAHNDDEGDWTGSQQERKYQEHMNLAEQLNTAADDLEADD